MLCCVSVLQRVFNLFITCARCLVCHMYKVCLIYCNAVRLVLIFLVYEYLFQHYCTGATMKTRLSDVVSV